MWRWLRDLLRPAAAPPPVADWYRVRFDESAIRLEVRPPGGEGWDATVPWSSIERVCFKAEEPGLSDGIYLFTTERAESWAIPIEARGGDALWGALVERGLFDAELAVRAMSAVEGVFCWPEPRDAGTRH